MPNFVNPWSTANDSMEGFLAKQDADARMAQDRARSQKIQDTNLQIAQENLASNVDARKAEAEQRRALATKSAADTAQKATDEADVQRFIKIVTDPNAPPALRQQAGIYLDRKGVAPAMINNILAKPEDALKPVMRIGRDGKMTQIGTAPPGTHFTNEPAPDNAEKPFRDSNTLPEGVKRGIDQFSQSGMSLKDARKALSSGWTSSTAAHPHADLKEASAYLTSLYPTNENPVTGSKQPAPLGAPPAATPPPATAKLEAPASTNDQDIASFLQAHGQPVTPANLAHVRSQMTGGK